VKKKKWAKKAKMWEMWEPWKKKPRIGNGWNRRGIGRKEEDGWAWG